MLILYYLKLKLWVVDQLIRVVGDVRFESGTGVPRNHDNFLNSYLVEAYCNSIKYGEVSNIKKCFWQILGIGPKSASATCCQNYSTARTDQDYVIDNRFI